MALLNEINVKGVPHPIVTDDGYYQEMTVGDAEQLVATTFTEDDAPYNFRTAGGAIDIGDRKQVEGIVGGTVAWNQLVNQTEVVSRTWESSDTYFGTIGNVPDAFSTYKDHIYLFGVTVNRSISQNDKIAIGVLSGSAYIAVQFENGEANGRKYRVCKEVTNSYGRGIIYNNYSGKRAMSVGDSISVSDTMLIDLTQVFGSTIADYVYSLEQANAGAGVAWFKKLFSKPYYAYNTGQLMSVKALRHITRGFNAWDEEWEAGGIGALDGIDDASATTIRSKNYIPVLPNTSYYVKWPWAGNVRTRFYDANKNYLGYVQKDGTAVSYNSVFVTPDNCHYMRFQTPDDTGTSYDPSTKPICINLSWDGERDGEYEEYVEHVYELDPDLELRGIPKLTAGNDLYYDGDVYEPDGTVRRKYGIIDLGTVKWAWNGDPNYARYYANANQFPNIKTGTGLNVPGNGMCSMYPIASTSDVYFNHVQKSIGVGGNTGECVDIVDADHTATNETVNGYLSYLSGVYLIYELAEPTTEEADSYNGTQIVDDFGTEEFVDAGVEAGTREVSIPVGHNSLYQPNLRAKLEMVPESPEDNGYYVVYHHDGINEYVPLIIPQELPELPTEDGTYTLKCTVASGSATLSFESEV